MTSPPTRDALRTLIQEAVMQVAPDLTPEDLDPEVDLRQDHAAEVPEHRSNHGGGAYDVAVLLPRPHADAR